MAAALRVFRRRPDASTGRLLPSWLLGPSPKLYDAAAASSLLYAPALHSSPNPVPSVLRRRYWSSRSQVGDAAAGLAVGRRAYASQLQVPSLLPVRHHGSTPTSTKPNSLERTEVREAMEYVQDVLAKLQDIDKSVARMKKNLWIPIGLLALSMYPFFRMLYLGMLEVAILEVRVEELEKLEELGNALG
ncbi:uncharacterized protein [Lolium perenne]|uniref:uncharacterized protein isoform X2 n=1 Tax=Lolium perenne TaxID=4522 RepID=UPI0021F55BF3|nr:uncharacterized protein LOC127341762 isoform X2 [Lolium perenne]